MKSYPFTQLMINFSKHFPCEFVVSVVSFSKYNPMIVFVNDDPIGVKKCSKAGCALGWATVVISMWCLWFVCQIDSTNTKTVIVKTLRDFNTGLQ